MFVGISDKISKTGTTDIPDEEFLVHARKRPWDDWQGLLQHSPIYHIDKARTPLLILHGKEDPRVFPGQSLELYRYDAEHAFVNEQRMSVHDRASAELAWGRATEFFKKHLG